MPDPGRPFFIRHPDLTLGVAEDNPPAPETPQVEAQQPPPAETTPAPEPRLYAGKYRTPEELEAGYENSFRELDRIRERHTAELQAERQRVDELFSRVVQPQAPPDDPFARLTSTEDGTFTPEALREAVRAEARRIAREEAQASVAPLTEMERRRNIGTAARSRVASKYADFADIENDLSTFVQSDEQTLATYNRMFGADPEAAMEWAYLKHRVANPAKAPRVSAADQAPGGEIPAQRTNEQRAEEPDAGRAAAEQRGLEYFRRYGNAQPYLRARLHGLIPDSHFKEG